MADEADSGTEQQHNSLKGTTLKIKKCEDDDSEKITVTSNSINNYDNSQDGIQSAILHCERCDKFETHSPSLLLVHSVQCATIQQATATSTATATATGTGTSSGIGGGSGSGKSTKLKRHHDNGGGGSGGGVGGDGENDSLDTSTSTTAATATTTINSGNENSNDQTNNKTANSNRKLFECDVCNMKFSNGANMRRHKMRHTGVKPYECRVCQKRFFRKDHLAEHFTTHTKTLPYHCPICNRGFQRQIAMRAHFQNEHVGQHDLVKTCPLCSYRAGTMKSLRVHFYNRHGIDLDNPGPGAPSSLLLALDPQNTGQYLPPNISATTTCVPTYSDSGDSLRSNDNATPPMHFLTPHVEISMAENVDSFNADNTGLPKTLSSSLDIKPSNGPNGISPSSPQSIDSNSNVPSSTHSTLQSLVQSSRNSQIDSHITPSISLIPIKQEPSNDDYSDRNCITNSGDHPMSNSGVSNSSEPAIATSSLTSIIKVSPLKSLLREDLKRRICARANTRAARNLSNNAAAAAAANNYLNSTNLQSAVAVVAAAAAASSSTSSSSISTGGEISAVGGTINNIGSGGIGMSGSSMGGSSGCNSILNSATTSTNGMITSTASHDQELLSLSGVRNLTNINKKYLQCLFCGIEFPDQTLYFLHKGCHSDSNPWKCNICGEQCNNVYEFNSHLLSKSHQ